MADERAKHRLLDAGTGRVLCPRLERADTFGSRLKGLLGRDGLAEDAGLWIEPCDSVHTFFMRFPIDVAFVDRAGVVVGVAERLVPWRATKLHTTARACVELPAGTLARVGLGVGGRVVVDAGAGDGPGLAAVRNEEIRPSDR